MTNAEILKVYQDKAVGGDAEFIAYLKQVLDVYATLPAADPANGGTPPAWRNGTTLTKST